MAKVSLPILGLPTEVSQMGFPFARGLWVMVNAFLNFQTNVTGKRHVLEKV